MNVQNSNSGNGETNGGLSKTVAIALAVMVALSVVSMPVAALTVGTVSDVDANGEQTFEVGVETGDADTTYQITTSNHTGSDSTELDYTNATASTDGDGSVTVNDDGANLSVDYTADAADEGNTVTITVSDAEAIGDGTGDYNVQDVDAGSQVDSGTFNYVDTSSSSETTYEVSGVVEDESGNAVSDGTVEILDSNDEVVTSTSVNSDGTYSVDVADGDYSVSHDAEYWGSGDYSITVDRAAETQDITVSPTTNYEVSVVDDGNTVNEFTYTLYESDGSEFGSVDRTDGSAVTLSNLDVGDDYTAEVTVSEENEDGEMVDVTYEETFTAEEVSDGDSVVTQSLDISTMDEASDDGATVIGGAGDTASGWFDSLVQEIEDFTGVSADLALVLGAVTGIIVVGGTVVIITRGVRSSF